MRQSRLTALARLTAMATICAAIAVVTFISSRNVYGQNEVPSQAAASSTPVYDPYPPGILPSNIVSEIQRVMREENGIEQEAINEWHALTPPIVTGNPPIQQNTGTAAVETLGKLMNFDAHISVKQNIACSFCHMPYAGYSGPIPSVNLSMVAYPGSVHFRAGKRTAQRYPYAPFFPVLQFNAVQGAFFGGNFWDSRATGYLIRSADAEQAQFPPVDPLEMGMPDTACIVFRLSTAAYRPLFEQVWGAGSFDINWPANTAQICSTPNGAAQFGGSATPVHLSPEDRTRANTVYNEWGLSIDAFEQSVGVSAFSSKFDAFLDGAYTMTADEMAGYKLFRGKGNCNSCHLDGRSTAPTPPPPEGTAPGSEDTGAAASTAPLFTCFGSANLGLPKNPSVAFYFETTPDSVGLTPNPEGFEFTDFGLGSFLRSGFGSAPNPNSTWRKYASVSDGKMQTSTARNVALTPSKCPTTEAPGPYFQKEFFHNGYIKSLKQLVHFYNTRDVYPFDVESGNCPPGTVEKVTCWPSPEVPQNMDMTIGKLHLTDQEENQIVKFLETLSDGFTRPYPDVDTFTGACMTGGDASTQGNASIIPAALMRR
jgi:cytochrome c peroxidase